jgi:hypothetical protein
MPHSQSSSVTSRDHSRLLRLKGRCAVSGMLICSWNWRIQASCGAGTGGRAGRRRAGHGGFRQAGTGQGGKGQEAGTPVRQDCRFVGRMVCRQALPLLRRLPASLPGTHRHCHRHCHTTIAILQLALNTARPTIPCSQPAYLPACSSPQHRCTHSLPAAHLEHNHAPPHPACLQLTLNTAYSSSSLSQKVAANSSSPRLRIDTSCRCSLAALGGGPGRAGRGGAGGCVGWVVAGDA